MNPERMNIPEPAETLVRNLHRRQRFLARLRDQEPAEIPEIVIKDTLLKFLDKRYQGLDEADIHDLRRDTFTLEVLILYSHSQLFLLRYIADLFGEVGIGLGNLIEDLSRLIFGKFLELIEVALSTHSCR